MLQGFFLRIVQGLLSGKSCQESSEDLPEVAYGSPLSVRDISVNPPVHPAEILKMEIMYVFFLETCRRIPRVPNENLSVILPIGTFQKFLGALQEFSEKSLDQIHQITFQNLEGFVPK